MVQSPSWEANWLTASQEIPRISRNPKVHYRTHKRPPPVSILGQPNPLHIPTSHLLEIRPNIIHPSTPRSRQWSLSLRFPHQDPIHSPLLTHTRHILSPAQYWVRSTNHLAPRYAISSIFWLITFFLTWCMHIYNNDITPLPNTCIYLDLDNSESVSFPIKYKMSIEFN